MIRRLLAAGVVQRDEVERAMFTRATTKTAILPALIDAGALSHRILEDELARLEAPTVRTVVPLLRLYDACPAGLCRALLALPVRLDARTGTVDVAAVDPVDDHVAIEFGFHLRAPVRLVRAPLAAIEEALATVEGGSAKRASEPPPPPRISRKTPPYLMRVEAEGPETPGMPQLRRHNSDMPIPLVRRSASKLGVAEASAPPPPVRPMTEPPPTKPGPFTGRAPRGPLPDLGPLMDAIRAARTRDEILDLMLNGLAMGAARVGCFVVRKGAYRGFKCNEAMSDERSFRSLEIPTDVPSVLATASTTGFYLGPIPRNDAHASLLVAMGGVFTEVAAVPVRAAGVTALVVLLDELGDSMVATKRAEQLARATGDALARVVQRDKQ